MPRHNKEPNAERWPAQTTVTCMPTLRKPRPLTTPNSERKSSNVSLLHKLRTQGHRPCTSRQMARRRGSGWTGRPSSQPPLKEGGDARGGGGRRCGRRLFRIQGMLGATAIHSYNMAYKYIIRDITCRTKFNTLMATVQEVFCIHADRLVFGALTGIASKEQIMIAYEADCTEFVEQVWSEVLKYLMEFNCTTILSRISGSMIMSKISYCKPLNMLSNPKECIGIQIEKAKIAGMLDEVIGLVDQAIGMQDQSMQDGGRGMGNHLALTPGVVANALKRIEDDEGYEPDFESRLLLVLSGIWDERGQRGKGKRRRVQCK
ncbi:hypothetical protein DFH27DRAFT_604352 [Peziza echinospora]|nr:hypothetical protein DFH27DRAFT_604352 [Peziza echinospora]